jgi:hypothetical protein
MIIGGLVVACGFLVLASTARKTTIGATADITEIASGIVLAARVDTGAGMTSLHCEEIEIAEESTTPLENVGKSVRILIENRRGDRAWIETKIADYSRVHNSIGEQDRYYVRLTLRYRGVEKETVVSLNDRSQMSHPLLLGRDFLKGDFLVDVGRDQY